MVENLPEDVKAKVLYYLENNQFPKAKEIHDNWIKEHPSLTG